MSHAGLTDAIKAAEVSVAAGAGRPVAPAQRAVVEVFGAIAGLFYQVDEAEVARRGGADLRALRRLDVLDALMNLPRGLPVPLTHIAKPDQDLLSTLPSGAVDWTGVEVTRWVSVPLEPQLAIVTSTDWRTGLKVAGRFAPYCARSVLLRRSLAGDELAEARMRASFYGVGLCVLRGRGLQTLSEPKPYVRRRHTPALWWFAEEAWSQVNLRGAIVTKEAALRREAQPRR